MAIAQKVGFPEVTTEKGNAGAFYLSSANKVGMGDHKNSSGRSKITFLHEYGHYIDFNLTGREGYLSNTDKGIVARKADEKIIKKAQPKIADERYKLFDEKVAAKAMKDSEDLLKIDPKKLSFGNKQNEDGFKSALSYIDYIKKKGLENLDVREVNSFRANLHYAKQVWEQVNPDSPIGALKETGLDVAGYVYDLFGSITKNKVGGGHSTAYYNKGSHRQGTEAFANIIAIANSGDEKAIAVA